MLAGVLADDGHFPLVVSHLQLIDNPSIHIGSKQKTITSTPRTKKILDLLGGRKAIFYVGHQNIPARVALGAGWQVTVPQTNQYICGYYWVRRYENGFYHTLIPIKSDVLQHYSRVVSNLAAERYNEGQWHESYREGAGNNGGSERPFCGGMFFPSKAVD